MKNIFLPRGCYEKVLKENPPLPPPQKKRKSHFWDLPAGAVGVGTVSGLEDPTAVEHRGPGATAEPTRSACPPQGPEPSSAARRPRSSHCS